MALRRRNVERTIVVTLFSGTVEDAVSSQTKFTKAGHGQLTEPAMCSAVKRVGVLTVFSEFLRDNLVVLFDVASKLDESVELANTCGECVGEW